MNPKREYWIDAVRSFACICVLTTHAPIPHSTHGLAFASIFNYFAVSGASILFFMISGALILAKEQSFIPFMKKRILRIAIPMAIWTVISLLIELIGNEITIQDFAGRIVMIPFAPQVGTYWFIYVIFGMYIISPPLTYWLSRCPRKELEIYLTIWGITLLLPYLTLISSKFETMINYTSGYLYYLYGYLGFFVLGHYLRKYVNIEKMRCKHWIVLSIAIISPAILYLLNDIPHDVIQNRMSINVVIMAICYFCIIKSVHLSEKLSKIFFDFAQHSFGIYLVHIIIMRRLIWPLIDGFDINCGIQIPLIVLTTAVISYGLVHLISKIPYSKYIIGL